MDFKGKTAVITGASQGIGLSIAKEFARRSAANIAINSIEETADSAVAELEALGAKVLYNQVNVANKSSVDSFIENVIEKFGNIDILINNAGITADSLGIRLKEEDFDKVIDVNLKGCFLTTQSVAKQMIKQKSGSIVNIASVIGITGNAGQVNYAASKAGVIAMTKSFAKELAARGIRANAVAPGFIQTAMTDKLSDNIKATIKERIPLGKLGLPEDVAKLVCFLASEDAAYITGQVVIIDGGLIT